MINKILSRIIFLVPFLLMNVLLKAQVTKDISPPSDFVKQLEGLPFPVQQDTATNSTIIKIKDKSYDLSTFKLSRRFNNQVSAAGESVKKLNELIAQKKSGSYKLILLISNLRDSASILCRTDFDFGSAEPLQSKIGYSWGAKQYKPKAKPPGDGCYCTYKINGLDCSGFIFQIFKQNGINLPQEQCNAATERLPKFLTKYLSPHFGDFKFEVKDLGPISINDVRSGDIIYFKNNSGGVYHIGILFLNDQGNVYIFQSVGQPNRDPKSNKICETNIDENHGPTIKMITNSFLQELNKKYGCVRISMSEAK